MPETDEYQSCPDAPRARYRHAAVNFKNKLYLLGGRDINDTVVKEVDVFDPVSNMWTSTTSWHNATSDLGAFVEGEYIYLAGGWDASYSPVATFAKYSPAGQSMVSMPPMPGGGRGDIGVISVPVDEQDLTKGEFHYVVGGFSTAPCDPVSTVESFDVQSNTWVSHSSLRLPRGDLAIGVIHNHMFAIAGETKDAACKEDYSNPGNSLPVPDVERFDAGASTNRSAMGTWVVEEAVPEGRFRFVASSFKDSIYLFGGQGPLNTSTSPPTHHILQTTMLYVPKSVADARDLNAGEIAGIVLAAGALVLGLLCCVVLYLSYIKYRGYVESLGTDPDDDVVKSDEAQKKEPEVGIHIGGPPSAVTPAVEAVGAQA